MPSFWENLRFGGAGEDQPGQNYDAQHGAESQDLVMYVSHPLPSAGVNFPSIIVVQEAFGVTRHIEKVCDRLAQEGYVAIAPAMFHRQHANPKLGYGDADVPARTRYMAALRDNEIIEDINQVIKWTQSEQFKRTNGLKVGIVGFCVGGRMTYLAATSCPGLSAAVAYYPGRILVPFGDGPSPNDLTGQITCPVMGNFGALDANPSPADVAIIEAKLKQTRKTYDFKTYPGANHGFNCDERASYHKASADDAWARTLGWFEKNLKTPAARPAAARAGARRR
jgi:carboxymethylenebutenolidase